MLTVVRALTIDAGEVEFSFSIFHLVDHKVEHGFQDLKSLLFDHSENLELSKVLFSKVLVVVLELFMWVVFSNRVSEGDFILINHGGRVSKETADLVLLSSFELATSTFES